MQVWGVRASGRDSRIRVIPLRVVTFSLLCADEYTGWKDAIDDLKLSGFEFATECGLFAGLVVADYELEAPIVVRAEAEDGCHLLDPVR